MVRLVQGSSTDLVDKVRCCLCNVQGDAGGVDGEGDEEGRSCGLGLGRGRMVRGRGIKSAGRVEVWGFGRRGR